MVANDFCVLGLQCEILVQGIMVRRPTGVFCLTDTFTSESAATGTSQAVGTQASRAPISGRILLAEDGRFTQLLISTILRQQGLELEIVDIGTAAVMRALAAMQTDTPFDMILMDIQMPEMDGFDATVKLRSTAYTGPIIAITANSAESERGRCLEAGFDDYMTKPITRETLLEMVERYVRVERGDHPESADTSADEQATDPGEGLEPLYSSYAKEAEMEALITRFVDGLAPQIENFRSAANDNDFPLLERLAHQLNGAAGGYGFMPVSHAAAALEKVARNAARPEEVTESLKFMIKVCARVRKSEA